jgi:regulator of sirC expression with transglutaminase-like and TPR domain
MLRLGLLVPSLSLLILAGISFSADDEKKPPDRPTISDKAIEKIAASARKSIAVVTVTGRDGKREGLGTGFIISADGLIATNLHVIGEARPISVQLADGKLHEVTAIHATDRAADLAIVRINAKDLTPLDLGDSSKLPQGAAVVALGNPLGLERSIVAGIVSGQREIDGRSMIQLAMPVERGNSGGPLVDLQGKVQGVITMKSAVTENLGFAVPINALKPLLAKPNPVAMNRWLTIGALDQEDWLIHNGARWRQRAGRITVEGYGSGFGGRSMCLSKRVAPEVPFEIQVTVKLDNEAGAAGLAFHADGGDKHYGFYPTGGGFRLTRFDGPDVFSWKILQQEKNVPVYRPGQFNTIKVRVEKERFLCFVNGQQVFEEKDAAFSSGQVGLVKFRETKAEFKGYQVAKKIENGGVSAEVTARLSKEIGKLDLEKMPKPDVLDKLSPDAMASVSLLRERAKVLEQQAEQLRKLALAVHGRRVAADLVKVLDGKEPDIDLIHAALLIARLDNEELDVDAYRTEVDRLAKKLTAELPKDGDDKAKLAGLTKFLFTDRGYHGSRGDYYNRSNSYLNEVIDDREGLPITLSVLFMDLGRRVGLKLEGVPLPGHFVVRMVPKEGENQLIDVYEGGKLMSREEAEKKVLGITGRPLQKEDLTATTKRAIIVRMIRNLLGISRNERDGEGMLRYLDVILALTPDSSEDRWLRAQLRFHAGNRPGALTDVEWLIDKGGDGIDREQLLELRKLLKQGE